MKTELTQFGRELLENMEKVRIGIMEMVKDSIGDDDAITEGLFELLGHAMELRSELHDYVVLLEESEENEK